MIGERNKRGFWGTANVLFLHQIYSHVCFVIIFELYIYFMYSNACIYLKILKIIYIYLYTCTYPYGPHSTFIQHVYKNCFGIFEGDTIDTIFLTCKIALSLWSNPGILEGDVIKLAYQFLAFQTVKKLRSLSLNDFFHKQICSSVIVQWLLSKSTFANLTHFKN